MEEIRRLLNRKAVFHCSLSSGEPGKKSFELVHTADSPIPEDELAEWMPPSLRNILREFGAVKLFQPEKHCPDGFRLFSPAECQERLSDYLQTIEYAAKHVDDELNRDAEAEAWSKSLRPVAEIIESGDLYAIDTSSRRKDGECPVVFLDHEFYYGGWVHPDNTDVVANDVYELVTNILKDPLPHVDSCWQGNDPWRQWFPEAVTFSDP